eukprot:CAMPEP_0184290614 /NCGR_PEP_ID=MMETSP1049-20130417/2788_1 /TAXON_ID=77928 /ORGANISM="Proteomonas sulcata, Strain CCMP704" /LENGTH=121 /DNA_ID=CAMNT_0026597791 /DNA_START=351 /DNA_END=717 /DNA_ORIENTATION=+
MLIRIPVGAAEGLSAAAAKAVNPTFFLQLKQRLVAGFFGAGSSEPSDCAAAGHAAGEPSALVSEEADSGEACALTSSLAFGGVLMLASSTAGGAGEATGAGVQVRFLNSSSPRCFLKQTEQ